MGGFESKRRWLESSCHLDNDRKVIDLLYPTTYACNAVLITENLPHVANPDCGHTKDFDDHFLKELRTKELVLF